MTIKRTILRGIPLMSREWGIPRTLRKAHSELITLVNPDGQEWRAEFMFTRNPTSKEDVFRIITPLDRKINAYVGDEINAAMRAAEQGGTLFFQVKGNGDRGNRVKFGYEPNLPPQARK